MNSISYPDIGVVSQEENFRTPFLLNSFNATGKNPQYKLSCSKTTTYSVKHKMSNKSIIQPETTRTQLKNDI